MVMHNFIGFVSVRFNKCRFSTTLTRALVRVLLLTELFLPSSHRQLGEQVLGEKKTQKKTALSAQTRLTTIFSQRKIVILKLKSQLFLRARKIELETKNTD